VINDIEGAQSAIKSNGLRGLGDVFGCDDALDAPGNPMFGRFEPHTLQFLVTDLPLSLQNDPFVELLLACFGGFAAGVGGLFLLLRFEPNFLFALFGSEL
jgi:hypothetical protein